MEQFPTATYRLQLNKDFNFAKAIELIEYFERLGVSHLYLSPCLQASSGSMHCYDVVDHSRINDELGGKSRFNELCDELHQRNMGIILDIVPNHMAIGGADNPWWWDVLENGSSSQRAHYFDVDWHLEPESPVNLILLPILGDHYGIVLENHEFELKHQQGIFTINYHDHLLPAAPKSVSDVIEAASKITAERELAFIASCLRGLPGSSSTDLEKIHRRQRDKVVVFELLQKLCRDYPQISEAIDLSVAKVNKDIEKLDKLIGEQNYKLACWKLSKYQMGYRRFFNINTLVGVRMEEPKVFNDSHDLVIQLKNSGKIDGFRVDHPDGLFDPAGYFHRLRRLCPQALIYAEKILEHDEKLPGNWPISGTTGYEFLNLANGLFVHEEGYKKLHKLWQQLTGIDKDYSDLAYQNKKLVIKNLLGSDINRLVSLLGSICEKHRRYRDFADQELYKAIREIAAALPIYRTYINPETGKFTEFEEKTISEAIDSARERDTQLEDYIFDFIRDILLLKLRGEEESLFIRRFQQFTGPVMAKSIEDTTFYVYNVLSSVNEVGGNPAAPYVSVEEFHQQCRTASHDWPLAMLSSSTHDTKRSEDVRARINLLSEIPNKWATVVRRWFKGNRQHKTDRIPDTNSEYLFYQTLVGSWPIEPERIKQYMEKAVREAKVHSNWASPDEHFEEKLMKFIDAVLADENFTKSLDSFVKTLIKPAALNSISQLVLKLTAPGIPDIYQGNEVWDFSLTDPDNRRPVDFEKVVEMLEELKYFDCKKAMFKVEGGYPKMFVCKRLLQIRKEYPLLNEPDSYRPIEVTGNHADKIISFMRGDNLLVIVPRFGLMSKNRWPSTRIRVPDGQWKNIFTDKEISHGHLRINDLLLDFPVAVLWKVEE